VNVYFDNTSGVISDTVYSRLAVGARVVICGTASISSWEPWPTGPRVRAPPVGQTRPSARVRDLGLHGPLGILGCDASGLGADGKAAYEEDILSDLEACPDALAGLYRGENRGKRLIRI
jgi:NADPH-dependent curcumin reductase CurA